MTTAPPPASPQRGPGHPLATVRFATRLLAVAVLLALCVGPSALARALHRPHNPWPRRFLAGSARLMGIEVRSRGEKAPGRVLLLANHVSWIDILALASTTGTAFVGHDGLASMPLLRWLCIQNDTVFIARHDRASVAAQVDQLRVALNEMGAVALFPEGTTSDGAALLPFKSSLLGALDPLPEGVTVQPVLLDYGPDVANIAWVDDEPGLTNFRRVLSRGMPVEVTVQFLPPLSGPDLANRKTITAAARAAIANAMGEGKRLDARGLPPRVPCNVRVAQALTVAPDREGSIDYAASQEWLQWSGLWHSAPQLLMRRNTSSRYLP